MTVRRVMPNADSILKVQSEGLLLRLHGIGHITDHFNEEVELKMNPSGNKCSIIRRSQAVYKEST